MGMKRFPMPAQSLESKTPANFALNTQRFVMLCTKNNVQKPKTISAIRAGTLYPLASGYRPKSNTGRRREPAEAAVHLGLDCHHPGLLRRSASRPSSKSR